MEEPLEKYRSKRDPKRTNEPFGSAGSSGEGTQTTLVGRFVIHQHNATRMHFDLRLQVGQVLESFAIPHGIPLDTKHKHLAVHTESHPLEYLHFEDVIPEGNYGAGPMIVWDVGGVRYIHTSAEEGIARGKLDFTLDGFKTKGRFSLIHTGRRKAKSGLVGTADAEKQWLLVKKEEPQSRSDGELSEMQPHSVLSGLTVQDLSRKRDLAQLTEARARQALDEFKAPLLAAFSRSDPRAPIPMICATEGAPLRSPDFLYELKLDGVRIIGEKFSDSVRLSYRSGRICTPNYADVARSLGHLPIGEVVLDGEIVSFDDVGHPRFAKLGPRIRAQRDHDRRSAEATVPVVYMVFDVLQIGKLDLRALPIEQRKLLLSLFIPQLGLIRPLDHILERGDALWEMCENRSLEGMVAKRIGSKYQVGPQISGSWVKIKREEDADFVVVGYCTERNDETRLGALVLGSFVADTCFYRGRVGTGFSLSEGDSLLKELRALDAPQNPVEGLIDGQDDYAVQPKLVVRVKSHGFSEAGHLRAAVFQGLRADVTPEECTSSPNDVWAERGGSRQDIGTDSAENEEVPRRRITLTNRSKVFWPVEGITKGDLLDYYERISKWILPYLASRPVVLVRYPDGIEGKSFYQWRVPDRTPQWIRTLELFDDEKQLKRGGGKVSFLIDSVDALLHIVNLGCIPIHVLASCEGSREDCDFLTVDLDLGERPFSDAVMIALSLKEVLDEIGLMGFLKTSGQRGLHVLVSLGRGVSFQSAKLLCELLGRILVGRHSNISTMERRIEKRDGKLYVDTGQTGPSRTIVAPYSVRAFAGARVSAPLDWNELHLALDPSNFTIFSLPERLQSRGDPMSTLLTSTPDLSSVTAKLSAWTQSP